MYFKSNFVLQGGLQFGIKFKFNYKENVHYWKKLLSRKRFMKTLADSAGHFLYTSNLSKEKSIVAKYNCVDLIKDFINLI